MFASCFYTIPTAPAPAPAPIPPACSLEMQ